MIHLDTCFLIDLEREQRRRSPGPASLILRELHGESLGLSIFVLCELYAGAERSTHRVAERARIRLLEESLVVAYPTQEFAELYARQLATLTARGQIIGTMDLLIGTSALLARAPLVTRNERELSRLEGLELIPY